MKKRQKGVAIVEFALVLPFLLLLTFITTEYGRAIWEYNLLTKSVRDAARYLSTQSPGTHLTEARNLVIYGTTSPGAGDTPLVAGLTAANVPDPTWQSAGTTPTINTVTVTVTGFAFSSLFTGVFGVPFGSLTFSNIQATMRSYL